MDREYEKITNELIDIIIDRVNVQKQYIDIQQKQIIDLQNKMAILEQKYNDINFNCIFLIFMFLLFIITL